MNLKTKQSKINKLKNYTLLKKVCIKLVYSDYKELSFCFFELKNSIKRLNEYMFYSDINPFKENISYVEYSRFLYEAYLNDAYIIQNRFRKTINHIKTTNKINLNNIEKENIEKKYSEVVNKLRIITKEQRGLNVHERRYNDIDFFVSDLMERENRINKLLYNKPIKTNNGKDLYHYVTVQHLDDVQDKMIENNNYIYNCIDDFIEYLCNIVLFKLSL